MLAKIALKAGVAVSLVIYSASLASAQIRRSHYPVHHHIYAHHHPADDPVRMVRGAAPLPYEAYGVTRGYDGVPNSPLIPIRPEVPPPVDPNEPASGSYGAMLEGRNPANTTP